MIRTALLVFPVFAAAAVGLTAATFGALVARLMLVVTISLIFAQRLLLAIVWSAT
jgi:hypothetical protein